MNPQNTQTPPSEIEPSTSSIPVPESISSGVKTIEPVALAVPPSEEKTKKFRRWKVILLVLVSGVLVITLGFAGFYFLYRTSNAEYDALLRDLRSMREDVKIIPKEDTTEIKNYSTYNNETRRNAAKSYTEKLEKVKNSQVLKNDSSVQNAYENDKAVIEEYGQSSIDFFDTMTILQKVAAECDSIFDDLSGVSTVKEFDAAVLDCQKVMTDSPHVPRKSFDEGYYVRLLAAYKGMITAYRPAYEAYEANDISKLKAMNQKLEDAYDVYTEVTNDKPTVSNTKNPSYILDDMIKTAEQRKSIFFRH